MRKKSFFFTIALAFYFFACTNNFEQVKQKEKEVMAIHDEAMAKMGLLHNLEIKLRDTIGVIQTDTLAQQIDVVSLKNALLNLVKAQEAMMDWMHQYQAPKPTDGVDKSLIYLEEQLLKINTVSKEMNEAQTKAQELLKNIRT